MPRMVFRAPEQRLAIAPARAKIERRGAKCAKKPRRQNGRAIRHKDENKPLNDRDQMHLDASPLAQPQPFGCRAQAILIIIEMNAPAAP